MFYFFVSILSVLRQVRIIQLFLNKNVHFYYFRNKIYWFEIFNFLLAIIKISGDILQIINNFVNIREVGGYEEAVPKVITSCSAIVSGK